MLIHLYKTQNVKFLGPQILRSSAGCLLCIPHDQIESEYTGSMLEYINETMGGLVVHVLITKCDAYTSSSDELRNLERRVMGEFTPYVREKATVTSTSGFNIFLALKVKDILQSDPPPGSMIDVFEASDSFKDFTRTFGELSWENLKMRGPEEVVRQLMDYTDKELTKYKYPFILDSLKKLYNDAEIVALRAHLSTIKVSHDNFQIELEKIEEFANQSREGQVVLF